MQQLTFVEPGSLEWWEVEPPPSSGPGQAVVRPSLFEMFSARASPVAVFDQAACR